LSTNSLSISLQRLPLLYPLLFIVYELAFYILAEAPFTLSPAIHCLWTRFLYPCKGSLRSTPAIHRLWTRFLSMQRLLSLHPCYSSPELAFYILAEAPISHMNYPSHPAL
jgi:hypothetical protein